MMKQFSLTKSIDRVAPVFGAAALSGLTILGMPGMAEAATIKAGSDYLVTGAGSQFFFEQNDIGWVEFEGFAIDEETLGNTDTIVERKDDVDPAQNGSTDIEILDLSLKSVNAVNGKDIFVTLQDNLASLGTMNINNDDNTWSSEFTLNATAIIVDQGTFNPTKGGKEGLLGQCAQTGVLCIDFDKKFTTGGGQWSHTPDQFAFVGPDSTNFFTVGPTLHDDGSDSAVHKVKRSCPVGQPCPAVPEPLTTLASVTALGFGGVLKRKNDKKNKKQQKA